MEDHRFWSVIESAWEAVGGKAEIRQQLAEGHLSEEGAAVLLESLGAVIAALGEQLNQLSAEELLAFDRALERKLYDLDRREVHAQTDGSDDGFLYARGFIVAAGKGYYEAVNANPAVAFMDLELHDICYLYWHLYREKFGETPRSGISRESCSNAAGWSDRGTGS